MTLGDVGVLVDGNDGMETEADRVDCVGDEADPVVFVVGLAVAGSGGAEGAAPDGDAVADRPGGGCGC